VFCNWQDSPTPDSTAIVIDHDEQQYRKHLRMRRLMVRSEVMESYDTITNGSRKEQLLLGVGASSNLDKSNAM